LPLVLQEGLNVSTNPSNKENHLKADMRGEMYGLRHWIDKGSMFLFVFRYSVSYQTVSIQR
jgi:hypothetical protein